MLRYLWKMRDARISKTVDPMNHDPAVHYWDHAGYLMRRFPRNFTSLLDVGIGSGWLGATVRAVYGVKADCVEAYKPYVERARWIYGTVWDVNVNSGLSCIPSKSYDIVCCLNTIEHFNDPLSILSHLERIAKHAVFVSSINYFSPSVPWDGNDLQIHRSVLTSSDMKKHGYNVRGVGTLHEYIGILARRIPSLDSAYLAWKIF